jgi:hypothetical protein
MTYLIDTCLDPAIDNTIDGHISAALCMLFSPLTALGYSFPTEDAHEPGLGARSAQCYGNEFGRLD